MSSACSCAITREVPVTLVTSQWCQWHPMGFCMITPVYVYDVYIYICNYLYIIYRYIYTYMCIYVYIYMYMYSIFSYCIYISSNPSIYLSKSTRMHIHTHTHTHTHTHDTGVGIRIRIHILRAHTHTHTYTLRHIPTSISESWLAGAGSLCRLMKLLISRREHRLFALYPSPKKHGWSEISLGEVEIAHVRRICRS